MAPLILLASPKVKFLSSEEIQGLRQQFGLSRPLGQKVIESHSQWQCRIYQVRNRVLNNKPYALYKLKRLGSLKGFTNEGTQVIKRYSLLNADKRVVGIMGPIQDELRWDEPKKEMISELSVERKEVQKTMWDVTSASSKSHVVIAYARCVGS